MRAMLRQRNELLADDSDSDDNGKTFFDENSGDSEPEDDQPVQVAQRKVSRFSLARLRGSRRGGGGATRQSHSRGKSSLGARFSRAHGSSANGAGRRRGAAKLSSCGGFCDHRPVSVHFVNEFWEAVLNEELAEGIEVCVVQQDFFCEIKNREVRVPRGSSVVRQGSRDEETVTVLVPDVGTTVVEEALLAPKDRAEWTVEDVVSFVIREHPQVHGAQVPFNEVLAYDDPSTLGKPHQGVFISYSRSMRFQDLLDALNLRFQGRNSRKSYVWLDVFGANQAAAAEGSGSLRAEISRKALHDQRRELVELGLDRLIRMIGEVALVLPSWGAPDPLTRMWCLWELYFVAKHEIKFSVLTPPHDAQLLPVRLVESCEDMLAQIRAIDFENSACSLRTDARLIRTAYGRRKLSPQAIDEAIRHLLESWMIEALQAQMASRRKHVRTDEHRLEVAALLENEAVLLLGKSRRAEALERLREALKFASACAGSRNLRERQLREILVAVEQGGDPGFSGRRGEGASTESLLGAKGWDEGSIWSSSTGASTKVSQASSASPGRQLPTGRSWQTRAAPAVAQCSLEEIRERKKEAADLVQAGKAEMAYEVLTTALASLREVPQDQRDDALAAEILNGLADILDDQGNYKLALHRARKALELQRAALGDIHVEVAASITRIGKIYFHMHATDQSLESLASALTVGRQLERSRRALQVRVETLRAVAEAFASQDYVQDAVQHLDEAVEAIQDFADFSESYSTDEAEAAIAAVLQHAAIIYNDHGEHEAAVARFQQAQILFASANGPHSPQVADCINNLAVLYDEQGLCVEALEAYDQALSIFTACLGPEHPRVGDTYYNMGAVLIQLKRYNEALQRYTEALHVYLATSHRHAARAYNNIAVAHQLMGNFDEAFLAGKQALVSFEETLGPDHPQTVRTREKLERLQRRRNRELAREKASGVAGDRGSSEIGAAKTKKKRGGKSRRKASSPHGVDEAQIAEAAKREDRRRTALYMSIKKNAGA